MNIEKIIEELFEESIREYETEKMIKNGGFKKQALAKDIVGGVKYV